jgi:hypothetical protein
LFVCALPRSALNIANDADAVASEDDVDCDVEDEGADDEEEDAEATVVGSSRASSSVVCVASGSSPRRSRILDVVVSRAPLRFLENMQVGGRSRCAAISSFCLLR